MLQITFRHMDTSASLRAVAEEKFARIATHLSAPPRCRLVIDTAANHSRKGAGFSAHVELSVGREELHLDAQATREQAACAVREAFDCVERQLQRVQRRAG